MASTHSLFLVLYYSSFLPNVAQNANQRKSTWADVEDVYDDNSQFQTRD
jgi:hypothetical protein